MGNFASRVHSKEDGKVYNILPLGDMPTVVFGRVIKEHSVPGMQYYFPDGWVKWHEEDSEDPYNHVTPFPESEEENKWGKPCIFTVPEDFDYSRLSDVEYVKQYSRTAVNLNAKTTSPYYIIDNGHIKCIKPLDTPGRYVVVATKLRKKNGYNRKVTTTCGETRLGESERFNNVLNGGNNTIRQNTSNRPNRFTLIPVGRVKYKIRYRKSNTYRIKYNITGERHYFKRSVQWFDNNEGNAGAWKLDEV